MTAQTSAQSCPKVAQHPTNIRYFLSPLVEEKANVGQTTVNFGPNEAKHTAEWGQALANFGQDLGQAYTDLRQNLAQLGQFWSTVAKLWSTLVELCPSFVRVGQSRSMLGKHRPTLAELGNTCWGPIWPKTWQASAKLGRTWAEHPRNNCRSEHERTSGPEQGDYAWQCASLCAGRRPIAPFAWSARGALGGKPVVAPVGGAAIDGWRADGERAGTAVAGWAACGRRPARCGTERPMRPHAKRPGCRTEGPMRPHAKRTLWECFHTHTHVLLVSATRGPNHPANLQPPPRQPATAPPTSEYEPEASHGGMRRPQPRDAGPRFCVQKAAVPNQPSHATDAFAPHGP